VVKKGSNYGKTSLYAQQMTLMKIENKCNNSTPKVTFCPCKAAIKALSDTIALLQEQNHAIILMIDANQATHKCYPNKGIKLHSIERLCLEHGLDDPFTEHFRKRPPTTMINKNHDIDYVFTWGLTFDCITTLSVNIPANSDHLGICIDINIEHHFGGSHSHLSSIPHR
jgi:hypothetical protein